MGFSREQFLAMSIEEIRPEEEIPRLLDRVDEVMDVPSGPSIWRHRKADGTLIPDNSGAPRMALHAAELGFTHPTTGEELQWEMPLPDDLQGFLDRLRKGA